MAKEQKISTQAPNPERQTKPVMTDYAFDSMFYKNPDVGHDFINYNAFRIVEMLLATGESIKHIAQNAQVKDCDLMDYLGLNHSSEFGPEDFSAQ